MWQNESFESRGGFVPNGGFSSPAVGDKGGSRVRRSQNIFPMTIKQILESGNDTLKFEDVEVSVVCLVARIKSVEDSSTKITYKLDDNTGEIEAINYIGAEEAARPFPLEEGTYGRIVGSVRTTKGTSGGSTKYLIVYKAFAVLDINEITTHGLEVLALPIRFKKLKDRQTEKINGGGAVPALANSMIATQANVLGGGSTAIPGLTAQQDMVYRCIKSVKSEEGVSVDQIIANLKNRLQPKEIGNIIEFLSGEGHIYSTTDDSHYKTTDW